ncbi:MAG: flagellar basal body P-ring formation chaperone FlgA [Parvularculaceae bacterium]
MLGAAILMILQAAAAPAASPDSAAALAAVETRATLLGPSLTRPLPAGAILAASDIQYAEAGAQLASSLVGKQTRRYLPLGAVLRASDIREPTLVVRNSVVRITFERGPLTIAASGRAMSDGALGETVRVLNLTSKATISAVVVARGVVKVP